MPETKREAANRERCIEALATHWYACIEGPDLGKAGTLLYSFLDAALRKFKPSERDKARKNALQWLRRRASR